MRMMICVYFFDDFGGSGLLVCWCTWCVLSRDGDFVKLLYHGGYLSIV